MAAAADRHQRAHSIGICSRIMHLDERKIGKGALPRDDALRDLARRTARAHQMAFTRSEKRVANFDRAQGTPAALVELRGRLAAAYTILLDRGLLDGTAFGSEIASPTQTRPWPLESSSGGVGARIHFSVREPDYRHCQCPRRRRHGTYIGAASTACSAASVWVFVERSARS